MLSVALVCCTGLGDSNSRNVPTLVSDIQGIGQVACGSCHTLVLSLDGATVWSFGSGDNGEYLCVCLLFLLLSYTISSSYFSSIFFLLCFTVSVFATGTTR